MSGYGQTADASGYGGYGAGYSAAASTGYKQDATGTAAAYPGGYGSQVQCWNLSPAASLSSPRPASHLDHCFSVFIFCAAYSSRECQQSSETIFRFWRAYCLHETAAICAPHINGVLSWDVAREKGYEAAAAYGAAGYGAQGGGYGQAAGGAGGYGAATGGYGEQQPPQAGGFGGGTGQKRDAGAYDAAAAAQVCARLCLCHGLPSPSFSSIVRQMSLNVDIGSGYAIWQSLA